MPLTELERTLSGIEVPPGEPVALTTSLDTALHRLRFLRQVGLGYLNLNRPSGTLSAGEAQRIQLAGLLGSGLTSLTVLLDEPSRGMHPVELKALRDALAELRDEGNTVIAVEHDLLLIRAADHLIDMGPGAGSAGGQVVASGTPLALSRSGTATGEWLRVEVGKAAASSPGLDGRPIRPWLGGRSPRSQPAGWLTIHGARANNLKGTEVRLPLGVVVGICGVSGSGKSSLITDTLGRALVRREHTTSFADQPTQPGPHDRIEGAPARTILVDQTRKKIHSPAAFLNLRSPLLKLYADSADAHALGLDARKLGGRCSACKGRGTARVEMGFLPDLYLECEVCRGTGHSPEAWQVRLHGYSLPEISALTLDEVYELFAGEERLCRPLEVARQVGLGYLVWNQPAYDLSGGEAQRLKIA
jgi:excinuclease ABC subunit A